MASKTLATPNQRVTPIMPASGAKRLISLDIFRGATIAGMILVNNPGDWSAVYPQLLHSEWNGCTFTDLIFPFFLFIVGISIHLSFTARRAKGAGRAELMKHAAWRALIIFLIGFFLNAFPSFDIHTVRITGVLQRIAICYLAASALVLYTGKKTWAGVTAALLVGYWLLMTRVSGFDLTPEGNLAAWVDRKLMYEHLWVKHQWDPEGLLSTLPAIATTLIGVFTGVFLKLEAKTGKGRTWGTAGQKAVAMFLAGFAGMCAGMLWDVMFPINKSIWTSSYVLFTAGWALVVLGAIYAVVEVRPTLAKEARLGHPDSHPSKSSQGGARGVAMWAQPFVWYGSNAIVVYAASSLLGKASISFHATWLGKSVTWKTYAYERFFAPVASPIHASLLWALAYVLTFLVLAWVMYRKAIFVKI